MPTQRIDSNRTQFRTFFCVLYRIDREIRNKILVASLRNGLLGKLSRPVFFLKIEFTFFFFWIDLFLETEKKQKIAKDMICLHP